MGLRLPRFLRRLIALFTWSSRDREMDQEMAFHLESIQREYVRAGMTEAEAERVARARFGDVFRLKEHGHEVRTARGLEAFVRDIRHTTRSLLKSPGFTIAVVLTLALGIGGNTAIFSIVDQVLLRSLPYPEGDQLLIVSETFRSRSAPSAPTERRNSVSPANWLDWQRETRSFKSFAAWRGISLTLTGVGAPARLNVQLVSSEFFPLLGVEPLLGRTFSDRDDLPNAPRVVVLSHKLWQGRFGADATVVGRIIQLSDRPAEVVGVMPAGFQFIDPTNDVWLPYQLDRSRPWRENSGRFMSVVARLQNGISLPAACAEMEGIAGRLASTYVFNKNTSVALVPLREELTGRVQTSLYVLYGAVGVLLSITCFNVANLLLARAASRRREIAIRTSLGAGRAAIIRQLLVESLVLASAGGALGIALAAWSIDMLSAIAPADLLRVPDISVDVRVLIYTILLTLATGLIVGVVPAVLLARESPVGSMRITASTITHAPRIRQALVIFQVAMTVMLLCGAGLLVRTLVALNRADTGFEKQDLLTMEVALPTARYQPERGIQFYRQAIAALEALPGVDSAAAANSLATIGSPTGTTPFHRRGTPEPPINERPAVVIRVVTPGYFGTLRIPTVRGREFVEADYANPTPGFVVNEAFAKAYLADIDPLTASISVLMQRENPYLPVIGVVGNVHEGSIRDVAQPTVYYSHRQMPQLSMTLAIRASRPAVTAKSAVDAIHGLDPTLAVTRVRTFSDALVESLARERLNAVVSGSFAVSGLLLASLGLYGLLAFLVTERTKEIGIRIALGAQLGRLTRSVIGHGLRLVAVGITVGFAGSLILMRSLRTLLFGVTPHDVSTYTAVLLLLCAVAVLASYVPARWAAHVQPLTALRHE
jgi:putative ABC transport system permease protein